MENTFQTSFIPKRPLVEEQETIRPKESSAGIIGLIGWILFFASIASVAGAYLYRDYLVRSKAQGEAALARERQNFEPELVSDMQRLDLRLTAGEQLLSRHVVMAPVFKLLEDVTLQSIRFTNFTYQITDSGTLSILLSGEANSYSSIALQSAELVKNPTMKNPLFSNLALDDERGIVTFDLQFSVDSNYLLYQNVLAREQVGTLTPAPEVDVLEEEVVPDESSNIQNQ